MLPFITKNLDQTCLIVFHYWKSKAVPRAWNEILLIIGKREKSKCMFLLLTHLWPAHTLAVRFLKGQEVNCSQIGVICGRTRSEYPLISTVQQR